MRNFITISVLLTSALPAMGQAENDGQAAFAAAITAAQNTFYKCVVKRSPNESENLKNYCNGYETAVAYCRAGGCGGVAPTGYLNMAMSDPNYAAIASAIQGGHILSVAPNEAMNWGAFSTQGMPNNLEFDWQELEKLGLIRPTDGQ